MIAVTLLVLLSCSWLAAGRYLPTRSDSSRREQIKEILRALQELIPEEKSSYPYEYLGRSVAKRSIQETARPLPYQSDME